MNFTYKRRQDNGDATTSYSIEGDFPIRFEDFFNYILENEDSFRIAFGSSNEEFNGWLGNRLEVSKDNGTNKCYWISQKPDDWFGTIKDLTVVKCWANGGWGSMLYIVTFDKTDYTLSTQNSNVFI